MRMEKRRLGPLHHRCWLAGVVLTASAISVGSAAAATGGGCAAANRGALDASVTAAAVTRELVLDAGDILTFSARSAPGATVSVASSAAAVRHRR